jgi:hypothetical protein
MDTPYKIESTRIIKSPFLSAEQVMDAIQKYKRGISIGFTRISSLKSMGLIPRSDGKYKLGEKYK